MIPKSIEDINEKNFPDATPIQLAQLKFQAKRNEDNARIAYKKQFDFVESHNGRFLFEKLIPLWWENDALYTEKDIFTRENPAGIAHCINAGVIRNEDGTATLSYTNFSPKGSSFLDTAILGEKPEHKIESPIVVKAIWGLQFGDAPILQVDQSWALVYRDGKDFWGRRKISWGIDFAHRKSERVQWWERMWKQCLKKELGSRYHMRPPR